MIHLKELEKQDLINLYYSILPDESNQKLNVEFGVKPFNDNTRLLLITWITHFFNLETNDNLTTEVIPMTNSRTFTVKSNAHIEGVGYITEDKRYVWKGQEVTKGQFEAELSKWRAEDK